MAACIYFYILESDKWYVNKWSEVKWSEVKWSEVKWSEVKEIEVVWRSAKCGEKKGINL